MSTHNIGFDEEMTKIIFQSSSNTYFIFTIRALNGLVTEDQQLSCGQCTLNNWAVPRLRLLCMSLFILSSDS